MDDLAEVILYLMENYTGTDFLNIGTGEDISITELTHILMDIMDYHPEIIYDTSKPDGTPRKLMHSGRIQQLAWKPSTNLHLGLIRAYSDFEVHSVRNST